MKFIQIARLLISIYPILISAVKTAEEALPESGRGQEKLSMIRVLLQAAYTVSDDKLDDFEKLWPAIASIVAAVVSAFNAAGEFRKGRQPAQPTDM